MRTALAATLAGVSLHVTQNRIGGLFFLSVPYWAKVGVGVLFLDSMFYMWHLLNHEVPLLWRFHRVHHTDLNMDVSTGGRFHIGGIFISGLIRMGLIYAVGRDLFTLFLFENLGGAYGPVPHSVVIRERNSNHGTILFFWDRIWIGVGGHFDPKRLGLLHLLAMPFWRAVR